MYSGTLNEKLSYEVIISAIKSLSYRKDIFWIISGEGPTKIKIINELRNYNNVKVLGFQPDEKLSDWLNFADIHFGPSKTFSFRFCIAFKITWYFGKWKTDIRFRHRRL